MGTTHPAMLYIGRHYGSKWQCGKAAPPSSVGAVARGEPRALALEELVAPGVGLGVLRIHPPEDLPVRKL